MFDLIVFFYRINLFQTIPIVLENRDVVAMARTGSGKTACFLIPMFEKLTQHSINGHKGIRALILSPTRELAVQVFNIFDRYLMLCFYLLNCK